MRVLAMSSLVLSLGASLFADGFSQTNLVSNISGLAKTFDPNLQDPWGMSFSAGSPIWVSDRAAGISTLYTGAGAIVPLVVAVPPGAPPGPTGQVFAGIAGNFLLNGTPSSFIFDTLAGTIDAWNTGTTATVMHTTAGASYEGLALASNQLYAANFNGSVDVFDSSFSPITTTGGFVDSNLPTGYSPFNIQNIGGKLYVEYGKVTSGVPVPLPGGGGYVDVFDTNGNLLQRLISNGPLDAPWGITMAPSGFGPFGGDLLVGNFGNGEINAFNPTTGAFLGTISDSQGNPIANPGLWAINFGNSSANPNGLYINVGLNGGADGLFAEIQTPEPATFALGAIGLVTLIGLAQRRRVRAAY